MGLQTSAKLETKINKIKKYQENKSECLLAFFSLGIYTSIYKKVQLRF